MNTSRRHDNTNQVVSGESRLGHHNKNRESGNRESDLEMQPVNQNESQQEWMFAMVNHLDTIKKQIEKGDKRDDHAPLPVHNQYQNKGRSASNNAAHSGNGRDPNLN